MNGHQIEIILKEGIFPHPFSQRKLVETHISYVILGTRFAYKFKKEIKYSFLDFFTLKKRKFFCEREVMLNNRISKGIYLDVVPVSKEGDEIYVDGPAGKIIDYAVKMKRLQDDKQMHLMLKKNQVNKKHIKALAVLIRNFHDHADVIHTKFIQDHFASRFNDLLSVSDFIKSVLGASHDKMIANAIHASDTFLQEHQNLFKQRIIAGDIKDCHGDLHSRNIFLYTKPIVFDCLEFNDEYRHIDILDEIAFFCMDLEAEGFFELSRTFTDEYFRTDKKQFGTKEQLLFTYYKCYRANVRAKVNALRAMKPGEPLQNKYLKDVSKYLVLMKGYVKELKN